MDSVSQAVLGAVVADLTVGRQLGRRAALWGLALGTLPDLDVLVMPWLSTTAGLSWHRGLSHGLLAAVVMSPLLGWLAHRWYRKRGITWVRATVAVALIWLTHVLIDCFNIYGTGIWDFGTCSGVTDDIHQSSTTCACGCRCPTSGHGCSEGDGRRGGTGYGDPIGN